MKVRKKLLAAVLTLVMALAVTVPGMAAATEEPKTLDVLFMHDMHSHLNPFTVMQYGNAL